MFSSSTPPFPLKMPRAFSAHRHCPFAVVCVVSSEKGTKYPITKCLFDISHTICEELEGFVLLVKRVTAPKLPMPLSPLFVV